MQADKMNAENAMGHDNQDGPSGRHGQNVAMAMPEITPTMAIKMWYNEVNDPGYPWDSPGFSGGTGHFTQVVWKETTHVGLGQAGCWISANYLPAGNFTMEGCFEKNVLPSDTTDADALIDNYAGGGASPAASGADEDSPEASEASEASGSDSGSESGAEHAEVAEKIARGLSLPKGSGAMAAGFLPMLMGLCGGSKAAVKDADEDEASASGSDGSDSD
jgi:hypothetical protein